MEWLLQKAIDSGGHSYSPQQVAEMLDSHAEAINILNAKIAYTFWILIAIIIGLEVLNLFMFRKHSYRIKKIEK